jgi:hypothetical protein
MLNACAAIVAAQCPSINLPPKGASRLNPKAFASSPRADSAQSRPSSSDGRRMRERREDGAKRSAGTGCRLAPRELARRGRAERTAVRTRCGIGRGCERIETSRRSPAVRTPSAAESAGGKGRLRRGDRVLTRGRRGSSELMQPQAARFAQVTKVARQGESAGVASRIGAGACLWSPCHAESGHAGGKRRPRSLHKPRRGRIFKRKGL